MCSSMISAAVVLFVLGVAALAMPMHHHIGQAVDSSSLSQCLNFTHYTNCNSGSHGKILFIQGCPCPAEPCAVAPGSNATITVGFIAGEASTVANGSVHALLGPAKIVFPLANPNGCSPDGGNLNCPLVPGQLYHYTQTLTVPSYAPGGVTVVVEWELLDENDQDIWCFEEPVRTS